MILLEDHLNPNGSLLFSNCMAEWKTLTPSCLQADLEAIQAASRQGLYLVGYLAYEAGYFLNPFTVSQQIWCSERPLLHFLAFSNVQKLSQIEVELFLAQDYPSSYQISQLELALNAAEYAQNIAKIKKHLVQGDSYQVNLTSKYHFKFSGDPLALYQDLRQQQRVSYGGYLQFSDYHILSFSPELFFSKQGRHIITKPMKGTMPRSLNMQQDLKNRQYLQHNEKIIAENVMIVDLLRNDLSCIAEPGSVQVSQLLQLETYETLHQMTSTIEADLKENLSLLEIMRALFPCGSITGAPKKRTMDIIQELEQEPRHIYTGAIGYIFPNQDMCFNVAIRTLYLNQFMGEFGVGGGVVYDSQASAEYQEMQLKAKFFLDWIQPSYQLLESIRYHSETGYFLLQQHLQRLISSAKSLKFEINIHEVLQQLEALKLEFLSYQYYKVRLILHKNGRIDLNYQMFEMLNPSEKPLVKFYLEEWVDAKNTLIRHKTVNSELRDFYTAARTRYVDVWDLIFLNHQQEITETSTGNLFIKKNNLFYTPPLDCGCLPGIMRAYLMQQQQVIERPLFMEDLRAADKIFIVNSVRGVQEVALCPSSY